MREARRHVLWIRNAHEVQKPHHFLFDLAVGEFVVQSGAFRDLVPHCKDGVQGRQWLLKYHRHVGAAHGAQLARR